MGGVAQAVASPPDSPTSPTQTDSTDNAIASPNGITNDLTVKLGASLSDPDSFNMKLNVEVQPVATAFTGTATDSEDTLGPEGPHTVSVTLAPGTYHWRAQGEDQDGATSAWVDGGTFRIDAAPNDPADLAQADDSGPLASGGVTNDTTPTFSGTVSDPDNTPDQTDTLQLEVELKSSATGFDGTDTQLSAAATDAQTASVTTSALTPGKYHWRARTVDVTGAPSNWVNFGVVTVDLRVNAAPNDPTDLAQTGNAVSLAPGGVTNDSTPTFSGTVSDPDNTPDQTDTLQLEVELKSSGTGFDGTDTHLSSAVTDAQTASVTWPSLSPGTYHWRARTVDVNGAQSGWVNFGAITVDFRVNAPPNNPTSTTQTDSVNAAIASPNGITNDTTVKLGATLSDPDAGDSVKLNVEVQPVGTSFTNTATNSDALGAQGTHIKSLTLPAGTYHWQAQTEDQYAALSGWTGGGTFRINAPPSVPAGAAQADGLGTLVVNTKTNDTSITFSATVSDPDNATLATTDTVGIEVEVRPVATAFTNTGVSSPLVAEGATASTTIGSLVPGTDYHCKSERSTCTTGRARG